MSKDYHNSHSMKSNQLDGGELVSQLFSLLSVTTIAFLFGIRTYNVQFKHLSYSRWIILCLYVCSWAFTLSSTIFIASNHANYLSCLLTKMACNVFYSTTKILIYFWLIEKVWIVSATHQSRWKTPSYRLHVMFLLPYIGVFTLMLVYHIADINEEGTCIIGLELVASIPLLIFDTVFNLYMTVLFVKPLLKTGKGVRVDLKSSRLYLVAKRTLLASVVSLTVSFANILSLVLMGAEKGSLCLTCCTIDVTINALTIHWVTSSTREKSSKETVAETNDVSIRSVQQKKENLEECYEMHIKQLNMKESEDLSNYRFRDIKTEDYTFESRQSSIQESESSRKCLTKTK